MAPRTRPPTGEVAYPIVLVEGAEKVGKTYMALALSKSKKVGRTFVCDFGEGSADEYGPIGDYEIVEHDGTFSDFIGQVREVTKVPQSDGKPNVFVLDSGTALWEGLKDWAALRARRSKSNQRLLAQDPDAEINVSSTYWNDANDRWGTLLHLLRRWDGIAVLICRGKEVAKIGKDGNPVAGQTEYRIEAQKALPYNVTAIVRVEGVKRSRLTGARSIRVEVPDAGIPLPEDAPLEHLIFDVLGAGAPFAVSSAVGAQFGRTVANAKNEILTVFAAAGVPEAEGRAAAQKVWEDGPCTGLSKDDEVSDMDWAELEAAAHAAAGGGS